MRHTGLSEIFALYSKDFCPYCKNSVCMYVIIKQKIALFWIDIALFANLTQLPLPLFTVVVVPV